jgi:flagellar operon protein
MTNPISIGHLYPNRIPPKANNHASSSQSLTPTGEVQKSFKQIFDEKLVVRFSQHAEQRLKQRGIEFNPEQMAKLEIAIDKAAKKGAKDSLVLLQDVALIVNVKNRMVVTAMDGSSMKDNVFTQIDSAVVVS